jgi:hypothetical protein
VRSKIMLEAEKRCVGRHVDLDSLLLFMVDQWLSESSRSEERLKALFVASDADGDGNLTLNEFTNMVSLSCFYRVVCVYIYIYVYIC